MSWRDETSQETQDDMDTPSKRGIAVRRTEQNHGEFFPYAIGVSSDGEVRQIASDPGVEHPDPRDVLAQLHQIGQAKREELRAIAFVSNVSGGPGDAVLASAEHRDGIAIDLVLPYKVSKFKKTVTFGDLAAQQGAPRVWV